MAAIEQHGRLPIRGSELQSAGRGHVCRLHFCDYAGERSIAQRILGDGQHVHILAALRIEKLIRAEADLLQARRIKIEGRHGPANGVARIRRKACGYPSEEQGGGGVVIEASGPGSDLV